ncbi:MAG: hypothetical protein WAM28_08910, partial [Chlamydiales bacterium]
LSRCWDQLKTLDKERKKEKVKQKQQSSEQVQQVQARIEDFEKSYQQGSYSLEEGLKELEAISKWIKELGLFREDTRALNIALKRAKEPLDAKIEEEKELQREKESLQEKERQEKIEQFKANLEAFKEKIPSEKVESLSKELDEYKSTLSTLLISKTERQFIERTLKTIRDQIIEKEEQGLLALSEDDRAALNNLNQILNDRKERRKEIKMQIEEYRKVIGGSGLDFEKAMRYDELMAVEKNRLAKIDQGIIEIEQKISELKSNTQ